MARLALKSTNAEMKMLVLMCILSSFLIVECMSAFLIGISSLRSLKSSLRPYTVIVHQLVAFSLEWSILFAINKCEGLTRDGIPVNSLAKNVLKVRNGYIIAESL